MGISVVEDGDKVIISNDHDEHVAAWLSHCQRVQWANIQALADVRNKWHADAVDAALQAALSPPPPPRIEPTPLVADTAPPEPQPESKEQRQDRRLQACIDAGLEMLTKSALLRLPDGVGRQADIEGVTRQSFSIDVKAAQKRRANAVREGPPIKSNCI